MAVGRAVAVPVTVGGTRVAVGVGVPVAVGTMVGDALGDGAEVCVGSDVAVGAAVGDGSGVIVSGGNRVGVADGKGVVPQAAAANIVIRANVKRRARDMAYIIHALPAARAEFICFSSGFHELANTHW